MRKKYQNQNKKPQRFLSDPFKERRGKGPLNPPEPIYTAEPSILKSLQGSSLQYVWLGHSSVLLRMHGMNILADPVFSRYLSPLPPFGPKRFPGRVIRPEELPDIDILLITHNHYDHLDQPTILALDHQVRRYIVPEGVDRNLIRFGIDSQKITVLSWHEQRIAGDLRIICTPAQHNSARSLWDLDRTLWCSYVLRDDASSVFFSGDSGFADHFQEIHRLYGDMDLAFMECGQYGAPWHQIHMFPEESAEACRILHAKQSVPIHWGAYALSTHPWADPPRRFRKRCEELALTCEIPVMNRLYEAGQA